MALARWNPMGDLMSLRREMDRLFDQAFRRGDGEEGGWVAGTWAPPVDIHETDNALVLKAELPGFSKEDISVEFKDSRLILRGERKHEAQVKEEQYHRRERVYGSFQRVFMLPTKVDPAKIQATYKDGILELQLPKSEAAKPKRVAITG